MKYDLGNLASRTGLFDELYGTAEEAALVGAATTVDELMELLETYVDHLIERGELDEGDREFALEIARDLPDTDRELIAVLRFSIERSR